MNFIKTAYKGLFFIACLFATSANATLITLTETQEQTVNFQDFDFNWTIDDWALNTTAELVLEVQGDFGFSDLSENESFTILLESLSLGVHGGFEGGLGGWTSLVANNGINAWRVTRSFTISAIDMINLLADETFAIAVNFNAGAHTEFGVLGNVNPYVTATVNYTQATSVPEPSTLAFIALSVLGLSLRRKHNV